MSDIQIPWFSSSLGSEEQKEIQHCFDTNWLSMGPKVKEFERLMAEYIKVPHAIAVSNGTVALDLALKSLKIAVGDEVIVPAMTYFATVSCVNYQAAIPVCVDIEKESFNLDPMRIAEAITEKTKAIIYIDYGGNPANSDEIIKIAERYNIYVIQDAAQSLGGFYKNKPLGVQADISTMSFHSAKVMTSIEGGMVFTRKKKIMEDLIERRNQGEEIGQKYMHCKLGTNARMTDIHAAVGLAQFRKLKKFLERRKHIAGLYNNIFLPHKEDIRVASTNFPDSTNAYFFYPILVSDRDSMAHDLLKNHGIDTRIAYPMPVYKQNAFTSGVLQCRQFNCPVADEVTRKIINLPIYPSMTDEQVMKVGEVVLEILNTKTKI